MAYIGKVPTAVPLSTNDLADNIITSAKISDGTITASDLDLTDNYDFTGTVTGAGESNTPYFTAWRTSDQTGFSEDTIFVMAMNNALQNASEYNTSTYRFTPTVAGKYYLWNVANLVTTDDSGITAVNQIRKNGSAITGTYPAFSFEGMATRFRQSSVTTACIETANGTTDYFDFTAAIDVASGSNFSLATGSRIGGFLLKT